MKQILSALLFLSALSAQAAIKGLPEELKGATEETIQEDAILEISDIMGCELKMDIPAKYTIVKSEQQDEEYAEYPGELSSFVLEATLDLPNGCKKTGKTSCQFLYNLYDERSYSLDSASADCR
jgi:hypothetical protein